MISCGHKSHSRYVWYLKGHQGPVWPETDFLEWGGRSKGLEGSGQAEEMVERQHFMCIEQRAQGGQRPGVL